MRPSSSIEISGVPDQTRRFGNRLRRGWRRPRLAGGCAVVGVWLLLASPLAAQTAGAAPGEPESGEPETLWSLWTQSLPERRETEEREKKARTWGFRWDDHPSLYFGRKTTIAFRARMQAHVRASDVAGGDASTFDMAQRRIGVEGRIANDFDFEVDYELGDEAPWRDAYVEYRRFPSVRVRAGQFKLPFSLDENTGATTLDFVYRSSAATHLAPGRDPGAMVSGRVLNSVVRYEAGVFAHDGRNARTRNPDRVHGRATTVGRLSAQPFRSPASPLRDLHVGVAFTRSDVPEGMPALRGRTALDTPLFSSDFWVQGQRRRTGLEARWRPGPFSLKGEYIRVTTERRGQSVEQTDLPPLVGSGWYLSGTWLTTGESKASGADRPRRALFRGGAGALELAARLEALTFGSSTIPGVLPSTSPRADSVLGTTDRAMTLGVNWYPYAGIKIQANLIRESIAEPAGGPGPSQPSFWSRVLRIQIAL